MADYDDRLRRLEERSNAASVDDRDKEFGELIRKRSAELLGSPEMRALPFEEWASVWEAIQAAAKLVQIKR